MSSPSSDEIRASVSKSYATRVTKILEVGEPLTMLGEAGDACCGDSCCTPEAMVTDAVVSEGADACCGDACCSTDTAAGDIAISHVARLYAQTDISDLPSTVTDVAFGCGNPTAIAEMKPGEVVLDLGSGGGIDCFLAAKMVGPEGFVYGVDMTPEMVALARKNAEKVRAMNVEFRLGEIEHLPLADGTVDVIISNCVINLAPDKDQVFREALRVLKPGGRLQVSDMVWTREAPDDVKGDMEKWAGCISGALLETDYVAKIEAAGFVAVSSVATEYPDGRGLATTNVLARKG